MKKIVILLITYLVLLSSCHPSKKEIVNALINAANCYDKEKADQLISDNFTYNFDKRGQTKPQNKNDYLDYFDVFKTKEQHITILDIQDLEGLIKTKERVNDLIQTAFDEEPFTCIKTYRFSNEKVISITIDSTLNGTKDEIHYEKVKSFHTFMLYKYGIADENEIIANLKDYLTKYAALPASDKNLYTIYSQLQGTYVSKDCAFYKKLIFEGKKTVTIIDGIFGFPFATSYELDDKLIKIKTDKSDLLLEIKDSDTLVGRGWIKGTFIKSN